MRAFWWVRQRGRKHCPEWTEILLDMQVKETYSLGTCRDSGLRKGKYDGRQEGQHMGMNWRSLCGIVILVSLLLDLHVRSIAGCPVCWHLMFTKVEIKHLECYFFLWVLNRAKWSAVTWSCPTLCDSMNCSLPGSSVHGIFQAIVLEWIAIPFSRGSSRPRDWTQVDRCFTVWATREVTELSHLQTGIRWKGEE